MSDHPVQDAIDEYLRTHNEYLEMMAAAYLGKTDIPADEVVLVEDRTSLFETRWYFKRKEPPDALPPHAVRAPQAQANALETPQGTEKAGLPSEVGDALHTQVDTLRVP